jgi:hypothetical protein
MRTFARLSLIGLIVIFIGGPLIAAPIAGVHAPTLSAPAGAPTATTSIVELLVYGLAAFGAIRIKDTGTLSKKFVQRATQAAPDYKTGVEAAGQDWQTRTAASGDNYTAGVQAAIGRKAFEKGVNEAGSAKYTTRAGTLGAQRYPSGVGAAEGDWAKGVQPYLDELKGMELPPRRPKGDPGNQARANAVATRLRARKIGA